MKTLFLFLLAVHTCRKVASLETVAEEVASLKTQVAGIEEAMAASEKEKEGLTESIAALKQQLDDAQTEKTDVMQQLEEQKTAFLKSVEKHVSQSVTSNQELQSSVHSSVATTPIKRTVCPPSARFPCMKSIDDSQNLLLSFKDIVVPLHPSRQPTGVGRSLTQAHRLPPSLFLSINSHFLGPQLSTTPCTYLALCPLALLSNLHLYPARILYRSAMSSFPFL